MQIHLLIAFSASTMLHKSRIAALDLNTASRFLLDVLNVSASMTHDLCSQIESRKGLKIDGDTLFRPFALVSRQSFGIMVLGRTTYAPKFIPFNLFWFPTSETSLINQIRQLLLHKFLHFQNRFFEAIFRSTGDVEVQWRVLI